MCDHDIITLSDLIDNHDVAERGNDIYLVTGINTKNEKVYYTISCMPYNAKLIKILEHNKCDSIITNTVQRATQYVGWKYGIKAINLICINNVQYHYGELYLRYACFAQLAVSAGFTPDLIEPAIQHLCTEVYCIDPTQIQF
jgi:hypothetical protein